MESPEKMFFGQYLVFADELLLQLLLVGWAVVAKET